MAHERAALRKPPAAERRPPPAARLHLSPVQGGPQPARQAANAAGFASIAISNPISTQCARISEPSDPAEREAVQVARNVVQMAEPARPPPVKPDEEAKKAKGAVQRAEAPAARPASPAGPIAPFGGSPLPSPVRSFMEPRFGANFSNVRIHTGESAAEQSAALNAHAFTLGEHVFFGRNQFQPNTGSGRELIAHELTHTIQQGAAVQRAAHPPVSQRTGLSVHRAGLGEPFDTFAGWANAIPGFRLLTVALGINPINLAPVERSVINILRGILELIPITGPLLVQALEHYGILQKAAAWIETQVRAIGLAGSQLTTALKDFVKGLSAVDIFRPGSVWERAKRIFTEPIDRLIAVGKAAVIDLLKIIREAVLLPLAKLAEGTRGYDLLKAVLGEDPVTGQTVPRTPETLIGGFLKLIGQEEIWQNMQKSHAIPRAWAWFQGAIATLKGFVQQIPGLFKTALQSLEVLDLFPPIKAFLKVAGVFGSFIGQFISWGLNAAWTLLEIIFDVVSPGALMYIKKTGAALKSILKNPLPFVGNLVKAAKLGFQNFAEHFLDHLKVGLFDWLTGSLPGIYIPKAFSLVEIAKFVFSVLGLTWENIRGKLVKAVGEPAVKAMETGFDIVVTLVRDGPAAAWDKIKDQLANLKDMAIGAIQDFVIDMVVKKAIPKLISMFIPGAGFISAILSIYDTVMVFVNKISQIIQVVTAFIDSIVAIAAGQIGAAAARVEKILAGLLSLAINFLMGFIGLGKVADKIMGIIAKIRAPIDKAIDWLINWIVTMARKLGKMVAQAGVPEDPEKRLELGLNAAEAAARHLGKGLTKPLLQPVLSGIQLRYGLKQLEVFDRGGTWWIVAEVNPKKERNLGIVVTTQAGTPVAPSTMPPMPLVPIAFKCNTSKFILSVFQEQLLGQETGLNKISVEDWKANRKAYDKSGRGSGVPQEEVRESYRKDLAAKGIVGAAADAQLARLAALHEPDLIAGGFNVVSKLGSRYINSSIGSQWKENVEDIEKGVAKIKKADWPNWRINVKLTAVAFTP